MYLFRPEQETANPIARFFVFTLKLLIGISSGTRYEIAREVLIREANEIRLELIFEFEVLAAMFIDPCVTSCVLK